MGSSRYSCCLWIGSPSWSLCWRSVLSEFPRRVSKLLVSHGSCILCSRLHHRSLLQSSPQATSAFDSQREDSTFRFAWHLPPNHCAAGHLSRLGLVSEPIQLAKRSYSCAILYRNNRFDLPDHLLLLVQRRRHNPSWIVSRLTKFRHSSDLYLC